MKQEEESLFARMLLTTIPLSQRCGIAHQAQTETPREMPAMFAATDARDQAIRKQVLEHNFLD